MADGQVIARAYVEIIPSMQGSQKTITQELTGVTEPASKEAGEKSGKSFGDSLAKGLKTTGAVIAGAMAAATGVAVATSKAFIDSAKSVAEYGDNVDKMSQKMGISATAYQEWDFIMQHCGASIESLKPSMKTLANAAVSGSDAFEKLGISQEQIASMSQEELFGATISALQNVEDETTRTALASKLLGRGATELGALFNMSASETEDLRKQVHDLGGVMSDEAVKDAANFSDELQNMDTALSGMKRNVMSQFLPGMSQVMKGLSQLFAGKGGLNDIQTGMGEMISKVAALAPQLLPVVSALISQLINSFGPMLPSVVSALFSFLNQTILMLVTLIPQLTPVITEGVRGICQALFVALPIIIQALLDMAKELVSWLSSGDNVKTFVDGVLQLISIIAEGLADALPILLPAIVNIIGQIADSLTEPKNVNMILKSVLYIVGAIVVALVKALPEIGGVIVKLSLNITNTLKGWGEGILGFFVGLWDKVKDGAAKGLENLKSKFTSIFENVKNIVKNGIDKVKSFFNFSWSLPKIKLPHFSISGKFSLDPPSIPKFSVSWYAKAMEQPLMLNGATIFGMNGGKLLGGGERGSELVVGTNKLMEMIREASNGDRSITINVYAAEGQNVNDLANVIAEKLEDMTRRKGAVYA